MFLGLRKMSGVSASHFQKKFGLSPFDLFKQPIEEMVERQLLVVENGETIHLTEQGKLLGNEVFQAFLLVSDDE